MAAAFKALNLAVVNASTIITACSWYLQAGGSTFVRAGQVPPNAIQGLAVDLTQPKQDPNGKPFVPVIETLPVALVNQKFTAATQALATALAATAIEAAIAALLLQGELPGPRIRVFLGRDTVVTKPTIQFQLSLSWSVVAASDAGPLGHFA